MHSVRWWTYLSIDIPQPRLLLLRYAVKQWSHDIRSRPPGMKGVLAEDPEIYFSLFYQCDFRCGEDPVEQEYLMKSRRHSI